MPLMNFSLANDQRVVGYSKFSVMSHGMLVLEVAYVSEALLRLLASKLVLASVCGSYDIAALYKNNM